MYISNMGISLSAVKFTLLFKPKLTSILFFTVDLLVSNFMDI